MHHSKTRRSTSEMGQQRRFERASRTSTLAPIPDLSLRRSESTFRARSRHCVRKEKRPPSEAAFAGDCPVGGLLLHALDERSGREVPIALRGALRARRCSRSQIFLASSWYVSEEHAARQTRGITYRIGCFSPSRNSRTESNRVQEILMSHVVGEPAGASVAI